MTEEESSVELLRAVMDVVKRQQSTKKQLFFLGCWLLIHALEGESVDRWMEFIKDTIRSGQELCADGFVEGSHGNAPTSPTRQ